MKFFTIAAAFLAVLPAALAVDQKKSAIVYFDDDKTPDSFVNKAMDSITKSGGTITHVYSLFKAFAVLAPQKALEMVQTMNSEYPVRVEDDEIVSAN